MSDDRELDDYAELTARTLERFFGDALTARGVTDARAFVDAQFAAMSPAQRHWLYHDEPIGTAGLLVGHEPAEWQNAHPDEMDAYYAEIAPQRAGRFPDPAPVMPASTGELKSAPISRSPGAHYQEIQKHFFDKFGERGRVKVHYMQETAELLPYIQAFANLVAYKAKDPQDYNDLRARFIEIAASPDTHEEFSWWLQKFADECAYFDGRFRDLSETMREERLRAEGEKAFRLVTRRER